MAKTFEPNFNTPLADYSKEELNKRNSGGMTGTLHEEYRDGERADISWEAEQLSKSYGIYLEYNRAKSGKEKDWMYMIRLGIPGGGPISPEQWAVVDELAEKYARTPDGRASIRLTTRQAIQYHWVKKDDVVPLIKASAEAGLLSLNGCGDNVRNIMACPLAPISDVYNPRELARQAAKYFQLPVGPYIQIFAVDPDALPEETESFKYGPQLLNRKFKMAFSTVHRDPATGKLVPDNCVELRTHDLGVAPVIENDQVTAFQIYLGGGQGEKNGKLTASLLAQPFARVTREELFPVMDAVVAVHQEWGDRQNRHWARLKYVIAKQGIAWFRERVAERIDFPLGEADPDMDIGGRHLHQGWAPTPDGLHAYGAFVECGRLVNGSHMGDLRNMVRAVSGEFGVQTMITPNQDLVFTGIAAEKREAFEQRLASFGYGRIAGKPFSQIRKNSGACVGKDTCRLAYTDSEQFEPELMETLEGLGWGEVDTSVGITGCERQCFRPATKAFGLVGSGNNRYQLKLFGTEDCRHQGLPLEEDGNIYLKSIPREDVPVVLDTLLRYWQASSLPDETPGYFLRRAGVTAVLSYLRVHPKTTDLVAKSIKSTALTV